MRFWMFTSWLVIVFGACLTAQGGDLLKWQGLPSDCCCSCPPNYCPKPCPSVCPVPCCLPDDYHAKPCPPCPVPMPGQCYDYEPKPCPPPPCNCRPWYTCGLAVECPCPKKHGYWRDWLPPIPGLQRQ
jgi:hypothetical protein